MEETGIMLSQRMCNHGIRNNIGHRTMENGPIETLLNSSESHRCSTAYTLHIIISYPSDHGYGVES